MKSKLQQWLAKHPEIRFATDEEQKAALDAAVKYRAELPTKFYDGKPGQYLCSCVHCLQAFIGDKRDNCCPDCSALKQT